MQDRERGAEDTKKSYDFAIARINTGLEAPYNATELGDAFLSAQTWAMQAENSPLDANKALLALTQKLRMNAAKNEDSENTAKYGQLEANFQAVVDALSPKPRGRRRSSTPSQRPMTGKKI